MADAQIFDLVRVTHWLSPCARFFLLCGSNLVSFDQLIGKDHISCSLLYPVRLVGVRSGNRYRGTFLSAESLFNQFPLGPKPPFPRAWPTETLLNLGGYGRDSGQCLHFCPSPLPPGASLTSLVGSPLLSLAPVCCCTRLCSSLALQKGGCMQRNVIKYTFAFCLVPSVPGNTLSHPEREELPLSPCPDVFEGPSSGSAWLRGHRSTLPFPAPAGG